AADRPPRGRVPAVPERRPGRGGARSGGHGPPRRDRGPRRNGHVRAGRRLVGAPAARAAGLHRDRRRLRDGPGGDLARHRGRPPDRGRPRRVGAALVLAVVLPRPPPDRGEVLGAADRAAPGDAQLVCSIGNVPLAGVLNGGISFGGVLAFVFG